MIRGALDKRPEINPMRKMGVHNRKRFQLRRNLLLYRIGCNTFRLSAVGNCRERERTSRFYLP